MAELGWSGIVWLTLSLLAAIGASCGFFLPYWLRGTYQPHLHHLHQQHNHNQQQQQQPYVNLEHHQQQQRPLKDQLQQQQHNNNNNDQKPQQLHQKQQHHQQEGGGEGQEQEQPPQVEIPAAAAAAAAADPVFLGTFRRCNYPRWDEGAGRVELVRECGRYTLFSDIPSVWWQISSVTCGTGAALALLVAAAGVAALCVRHVMTKSTAKMAALLQLMAGLLIGGGVAVYPLGWYSSEVRQVCGPDASPYQMGSCELYWAFYLTASAGGLTLLCSLLALCAPSSKADHS